jgi:large subunit ribosomal protein L9
MQVILLENVAKVGKKFDIVDVAPGFARNFLLARSLAEPVTKSNAKRVADLQSKRAVEEKRQTEALEKVIVGMKDVKVEFVRKANEEGILYAGITRGDIAEAVAAALGAPIGAEHVVLEHSIKEVGEQEVVIEVADKKGSVTVLVTAE